MRQCLHRLTPTLTAHDPRGLVVRAVNYQRSAPAAVAERRVIHSQFNGAGHCVAQRDPRFFALQADAPQAPANCLCVHSLSGRELSRDSVDSGFACTLPGAAGQPVFAWDGKGNQRTLDYDALLRPLALFEQGPEQPPVASERFTYADADPEQAASNCCGRLVRHDDPAGSQQLLAYTLGGGVGQALRQFCASADWPDWPASVEAREALLDSATAASLWRHGPLGQVLEQIDAAGNRQTLRETLAGQLDEVHLQLAGAAWQRVRHSVRYDAFGQLEEETLGNGVHVQREYRKEDGRLLRLRSQRASGEWLQDLQYSYDPVGNALSIEDQAQPLRHFANQRIEPRCDYVYDSLYQLIEASGWEAGEANRGPLMQADASAVARYRQTYAYDAGGNLLELVHAGPQAHGRTLKAGQYSNRCLPTGEAFADSFDANGNLQRLQPGQTLHWDVRNQLREVRPVTRDGAADDTERYVYDGGGQRVRKLGVTEAANRTLVREVLYLPGLERHENSATGESFEVITVQAGTCTLRVVHWLQGKPDGLAQDQQRYGLGDHLGSACLELDGEAALISHEVFHPFGSTAWWAGRDELEANYKTLRYSGKERDATGLYYYGARYYRTDWQRWLNPDPAREVDGLNLYCMVGNSPVNRRDPDGRQGEHVIDDVEDELLIGGNKIIHSGLENFPEEIRAKVSEVTQIAREMADSARSALEGGRGQKRLTQIMTSAFGAKGLEPGPALEHLKGELLRSFKRSGRFLRRLENEGWRLLLVEYADPRVAATAFPSKVRSARIALSSNEARWGVMDMAANLLHESLHAMDMELGAQANSDNVLDYWYAMPELAEGGGTASGLRRAMHRVFRRIARRGPAEARMSSRDQSVYTQLINARTEQLGLPRARNAAERQRYFRRQPLLRHMVGARNADTLTGIGFTLRSRRRN